MLVVGAGISLPATAHAAVPCTEAALVTAVNTTNEAGGGVITLTPDCTYNLTAGHGDDGVHGSVGLPPITTTITMEGDGNTITRSGASAFRILQVATTGDLTLKAVTISNGSAAGLLPAGNGGGILNFGALTLTNSTVSGNTAAGTGGGVQSGGGAAAVTLTGSTLSGNTAAADGGGLYSFGTATLTSSFVTGGNQGARGGGLASVDGILTLTSTPISGNSATGTAGGFFRLSGNVTVNTSPISANSPNNCVGSVPSVPGCTA
ncbi:hypothetical protein [Crossiella sp. CA198]|uniref:hypothetical protein n=1 Tax=Crossiella sp. CA198 TaxID=3455607 RepID=UPI003F8D2243